MLMDELNCDYVKLSLGCDMRYEVSGIGCEDRKEWLYTLGVLLFMN